MSSSRQQKINSVSGQGFDKVATLGVSQSYARRDHSHGTPNDPGSEKGVPNGYASLDADGTVPDAQIPEGITRDAEADLAYAPIAHVSATNNPHETTLQKAAAAGGTITSPVTFEGRAILPMGEISYFSMTGTAVTIAAQSDGSTNMVMAAPTTTLSTDMGFDNGGANNGRLRYTGATTKIFHVACTISIAPASANDTFVFGIAKNGTVIAASKVLLQAINASTMRSTAMHVMTELSTNDYLELYVGNTTDADDCTVHSLNLFAMGM